MRSSSPIRTQPISWMMPPPGPIVGERIGGWRALTSPRRRHRDQAYRRPAKRLEDRAEALAHVRTWLISWSLHRQWNRRTGIPHLSCTSGSISQNEC